ncbi:MAG TPA: PilT/PilU family type 4a pilus ATPase [Polyangiaceae bacterium]|nr:PilT/PilU family type 4a pilus ATPase [Polyangiaceae bacterium]
MAGIDSILNIVVQQGADELRLGTDRAPKMLALGVPKRLSIPATSEEMLRHLLGPLLSDERERSLRLGERVEFSYEPAGLGAFAVVLSAREGAPAFAIDAVFARNVRPPPAATPPAPPARGRAPSGAGLPDEAPAARPLAPPADAAAPRPPAAAPPFVEAAAPAAPEAAPEAGPLLEQLLDRAVALGASDLHLLSGEAPVLRVNGRLLALTDEPPADAERVLAGCLTPSVRRRLAEGRSADLALVLPGGARFRLNVYRAAGGLAAAARVLYRQAPELSELKLPAPLDELVDLPHGLVVVCGATGSGKSTTLAALAREALRRRGPLLISLEDPIEYELRAEGGRGLVRQRQIGREVRDFATGLRDALREDPDVLLIGEMRDPETISLALTAAETGHLVLTSLHSRSAASAVERIVDAYPAERQQQVRAQLADALRAVVAQRLLPDARGAGRLPALEVLRGTHNVANIIREGRTAQLATAMQSGGREGMQTLERCLADLVRAQRVSLAAARAAANDPEALTAYARG